MSDLRDYSRQRSRGQLEKLAVSAISGSEEKHDLFAKITTVKPATLQFRR